jgi:ABC-type transport system involved in multi-copper enzyme maturation permease subunit
VNKIFRKLDIESESLFSVDSALLLVSSTFAAVSLILLSVIFQPRGSLLGVLLLFFSGGVLALACLGSMIYAIFRMRKYGIVVAMLPLAINLFTVVILLLFGQERIYLSDSDVIVYSRDFSSDGQYVVLGYALNEARLGSPTHYSALPVQDTLGNLSRWGLPDRLRLLNWNKDNSISVWAVRLGDPARDIYKVGDSVNAHGFKLRVLSVQ